MKRILLMVFRNLLRVTFYWFKLCHIAAHADDYTEEERYHFLKQIVTMANTGGNVTIEAHGKENIFTDLEDYRKIGLFEGFGS